MTIAVDLGRQANKQTILVLMVLNFSLNIFPIQIHLETNLTCCKVGQGQPRINICANLLG